MGGHKKNGGKLLARLNNVWFAGMMRSGWHVTRIELVSFSPKMTSGRICVRAKTKFER